MGAIGDDGESLRASRMTEEGANGRDLFGQGGFAGDVLPWDDVLHEGPVPEGLSLDELRQVRARFIAERGWGDFDTVLADFSVRDGVFENFEAQGEVSLWFEFDLYDQLQLCQILAPLRPLDTPAA